MKLSLCTVWCQLREYPCAKHSCCILPHKKLWTEIQRFGATHFLGPEPSTQFFKYIFDVVDFDVWTNLIVAGQFKKGEKGLKEKQADPDNYVWQNATQSFNYPQLQPNEQLYEVLG